MGYRLRRTVRLISRDGFQPRRLKLPALLLAIALPALSGCHSPYVQADIRNASGQPISLLEVDYPSASFGKETLAPGAEYRYRFKILGSGDSRILWTDASHKDHTVPGPNLREGQQGTLAITITGPAATWAAHLQP